MKFNICGVGGNHFNLQYSNKEAFLNALSAIIDDCVNSNCTLFFAEIDSNAKCYDRNNNGEYKKTAWGELVLE
jgi:hypothetical protein